MATSRARASDDDLTRWLHPAVREVHRDDWLWVLDKPAGVLSHPNPPRSKASNALLRAPYDQERELYRVPVGERIRGVHLVHRLDLETSGLILCAFSPEAAAGLKEQLYRHEVEKSYRALVVGIPRRDRGEWADRLRKVSAAGRAEVRVDRRGAPNARTAYRVLEVIRRPRLALLSLEPLSGRTHQLRVQAASRGLPLAGDERYGDFTANRYLREAIGLRHMFLHAWRLELRHPTTGHLMKFRREPGKRLLEPLQRARELPEPVPRRGDRLSR